MAGIIAVDGVVFDLGVNKKRLILLAKVIGHVQRTFN